MMPIRRNGSTMIFAAAGRTETPNTKKYYKTSLRLVHTDRVKCSRIGQFLRTHKTWSVRKFSILLRKHMRFYAGLNEPLLQVPFISNDCIFRMYQNENLNTVAAVCRSVVASVIKSLVTSVTRLGNILHFGQHF